MTRKASIRPGTWISLLIFAPLLPTHAREVSVARVDGEYRGNIVEDVHFFSVIQIGLAEFIEVNVPLSNFTLARANSSVAVGQLDAYPPSILQWLDDRQPAGTRNRLSLLGGLFLGALAIVACCLCCSGETPKRQLPPWQLLPPVSGPSRYQRKAGEAQPAVGGVLDPTVGSTSIAQKEAACCCGIQPYMSSWSSSANERPQSRNAAIKTQAIKALATPHLSIISVSGIIIDTDAGYHICVGCCKVGVQKPF